MARVAAVVEVRRVIQYDPRDGHRNSYMVVTIRVGNHRFELGKNEGWRRRGLWPDGDYIPYGAKRKYLAELRRALGLSKRSFSAIMGVIGSFWNAKPGTYRLLVLRR